MGEILDEKDEWDDGIRVSETYFVQLFDRTRTRSVQRSFQQRLERPPSIFYAVDSEQKPAQREITTQWAKVLPKLGFTDAMKFQAFPVA